MSDMQKQEDILRNLLSDFRTVAGIGPDGGFWNSKFSNENFPIVKIELINIVAYNKLEKELESLREDKENLINTINTQGKKLIDVTHRLGVRLKELEELKKENAKLKDEIISLKEDLTSSYYENDSK